MWTRDSMTLWIAAGAALVLFLQSADNPPTMWGYGEWLQFAAFVLAWGAGKLQTSPLPGEHDASTLSGPRMWFLPILLVSAIGVGACGGKVTLTPQPPTEDQVQAVRAKAIQIAAAVEQVGELVASVQQATQAAAQSGLITPAQRDTIYQHIIDLAPGVTALIDIAQTVTVDPALRTVVRALMDVVDRFVADLGATGHSALQQAATAIRAALAVAAAYLGGGL